eukprot:100864-Ditylum_brightwellii.AAC.1
MGDNTVMVVNTVMIPTICKKSTLTYKKLKNEVDWSEWLAAKKVQLDSMEDLNMYGEPTYIPKGAKILSPVWTYMIKHDGRKK